MQLESNIGRLSVLGFLPEQQFLHYAWPCVESMESRGKSVRPEHKDELLRVLTAGTRPRRSLLRFVFPDAYRGITVAAQTLRQPRWSQTAVEQYFLLDHDAHIRQAAARGIPAVLLEPCRVRVVQVIGSGDGTSEVADAQGRKDWALNPFRLPLTVGTPVAVHYHTVVDVLHPEVWE